MARKKNATRRKEGNVRFPPMAKVIEKDEVDTDVPAETCTSDSETDMKLVVNDVCDGVSPFVAEEEADGHGVNGPQEAGRQTEREAVGVRVETVGHQKGEDGSLTGFEEGHHESVANGAQRNGDRLECLAIYEVEQAVGHEQRLDIAERIQDEEDEATNTENKEKKDKKIKKEKTAADKEERRRKKEKKKTDAATTLCVSVLASFRPGCHAIDVKSSGKAVAEWLGFPVQDLPKDRLLPYMMRALSSAVAEGALQSVDIKQLLGIRDMLTACAETSAALQLVDALHDQFCHRCGEHPPSAKKCLRCFAVGSCQCPPSFSRIRGRTVCRTCREACAREAAATLCDGVLTQVFRPGCDIDVTSWTKAVTEWLPGDLPKDLSSLTKDKLWPYMMRALSSAIEKGELKSAEMQKLFANRFMIDACAEKTAAMKLADAVNDQLCHGCGERPPHVKRCQQCKGFGRCELEALGICIRGRTVCQTCYEAKRFQQTKLQRSSQVGPRVSGTQLSLSACSGADLSVLQKLWVERGGSSPLDIAAAWSIDNPYLSNNYHARRAELQQILGREPDELQGFHGTHPQNVFAICQNGFDSGRRSGQVFGSGEYFAKNPLVSRAYSKGGQYMLICRLCLGRESSSMSNADGDHLWVPSQQYYVISAAAQALPLFIIKFSPVQGVRCEQLERILALPNWSNKTERVVHHIPQNRPCCMTASSTKFFWMGYLHNAVSDRQLHSDVVAFFKHHAREYADGIRVQILCSKYKKAHVQCSRPLPKELVHRLNKLPFVEDGIERYITIDDFNGSQGQRCPKWIAGYCRGRNLRHTTPCWCDHVERPTALAHFSLEEVSLRSAKGEELVSKFCRTAPFHDCSPSVVEIHAIKNDILADLHEKYRQYLLCKNREEPAVHELYHGTNNKILDTVYTHGLQPPSDCNASDECPVSGGLSLNTTLCDNQCPYCTTPHAWDRCHMFGLGIYLADQAAKSHRYVSQPLQVGARRRYRMVVCSVLGRPFEVAGHLRTGDAMHDVTQLRFLAGRSFEEMLESPKCMPCSGAASSLTTQAENHDLLFVKGLGHQCRPGFSVFNSEFIAFHPFQCLPKYQITYEG